MLEFPAVGFPTDPRLHIETKMARLDPYVHFAKLTVDVKRNGYDMSFAPARLKIDSRPYFDSVGLKCVDSFTQDYAAAARQAAWQAAADASQKGDAVECGSSIGALAMLHLTRSIDRMLSCIQPTPPEINCKGADLNVSYVKDQYIFTWDTGGAGAEYTPYSIDMWVEFLDKTELRGE